MLVMAVSIGSIQNNGPSTGTTLGFLGHFEIMVENPDGSASYAQGDNFVTGEAKNAVGNTVFEGAAHTGVMDSIVLGNGTAVITEETINAILAITGVASDADNTGNCDNAGSTDTATTAQVCTIVTTHVIPGGDCFLTCTISEVAVGFDANGVAGTQLNNQGLDNTFAFSNLATNVIANNGATVTTTYKVATGGVVP